MLMMLHHYLESILNKFKIQNYNIVKTSISKRIKLSNKMSPANHKKLDEMKFISYGQAIGSIMYAMICTKPNLAYAISLVSIYQSKPTTEH